MIFISFSYLFHPLNTFSHEKRFESVNLISFFLSFYFPLKKRCTISEKKYTYIHIGTLKLDKWINRVILYICTVYCLLYNIDVKKGERGDYAKYKWGRGGGRKTSKKKGEDGGWGWGI